LLGQRPQLAWNWDGLVSQAGVLSVLCAVLLGKASFRNGTTIGTLQGLLKFSFEQIFMTAVKILEIFLTSWDCRHVPPQLAELELLMQEISGQKSAVILIIRKAVGEGWSTGQN
jgi:hypothetical protein